jgi:hypothetical protein
MIRTVLQEWECVVLDFDANTVFCELFDLTNPINDTEVTEIWTSKLPENIVKDLCEGLAFYWQTGHKQDDKGQIRNFSDFFYYDEFLLNTDKERIEEMRRKNNEKST